MMVPAPYFETIRARAAQLWDQLEADPELAGPWYQLFQQVQSPRHVVSELLQNADDAGATAASVSIQDGEFFFCHNGEDFKDEHFASLCRFGYSNKRALHTIGFRGIGFKSTFSIGDEVRLLTPTISVAFRRQRFSEPVWITGSRPESNQTQIRIIIKDEYRQRELESCLDEWIQSPGSLLFFRNLRALRVGDRKVHWDSAGPGPIDGSEWMVVSTAPEKRYLLLRSSEENFPEDALQEIRQERMITLGEEINFPPSRVEIVLGLESYLYVVLRTGVKTRLPFACNAPFIQDPARVKIKAVETSPTNRWLLHLVGKLAAGAILGWLNKSDLSAEQRCEAYKLFPDVDRSDQSVEGRCGTVVQEGFKASIENQRFLLSEQEQLQPWGKCVAVPSPLLDIWPASEVAAYFVKDNRSILSRRISDTNRQKLIRWCCVEEIQKEAIVDVLEATQLPRPETWHQLLLLWCYVSTEVTNYFSKRTGVRIVPVQGKNLLYSARDVVRLGEKRLLQSDDDWDFLSQYLLVLNQNWPRYLAEQRRHAEEFKDEGLGRFVGYGYEVLRALDLSETSDVSGVIDHVAKAFFSKSDLDTKDFVRLAHLAAALGASLSPDFKFVTQNDRVISVKDTVIADLDADLDSFVDVEWYESHVLHESYFRDFESCTEGEWKQWLKSDRSRVLGFTPPVKNTTRLWSKASLQRILNARGYREKLTDPYMSNEYSIEDWDFEKTQWAYWEKRAAEDETYWAKLLRKILAQASSFWGRALEASAFQLSSRGRNKGTASLLSKDIPAGWVNRFRSLPCLQDTWGGYRLPAELLRRTLVTESLLDVEPFVRGDLDTESSRPLLIALGVRDTPTGPERLLDRLIALAGVEKPPIYEVGKWYHRLDQMLVKCSTDDFQKIKDAFQRNRLILTESNEWASTSGVFIAGDEEDVPGAAVVHPSVCDLSLWRKIGVADRPTAELAINWLTSLSLRRTLSEDEVRRVRLLLPKYPERIWYECGRWLNLENQWVPVETLSYALSMQTLVPWKHLFPTTKERTADFQKLSAETCQQRPFIELPSLADSIEERLQETLEDSSRAQRKPWLVALGLGLERIVFADEEETQRIQQLAGRLVETSWQVAADLQAIPYIAGTPAGVARRIDVLWKDRCLYVEDRSAAKIAKGVALEVGRVFGRQEIIDAVKLCYDRSPDFVTEYLEENFTLRPVTGLTEDHTGVSTDPDAKEGQVSTNGPSTVATTMTQGFVESEPNEPSVPEELEQEMAGEFTDIPSNEPTNNIQEDMSEGDTDSTTRVRHRTPPTTTLMERFAGMNGFVRESSERFNHLDGSWIGRMSGSSFPWERRDANGSLLQYYWAKEHCLERGALELDSEIWEACKKSPDLYSLILNDPEGVPLQISGRRLIAMCDAGDLKLYPASYRLVFECEQK